MIQANELRKNNKVLLEGMLLTVKEIKENEATFFETPAAVEYPDIDPIPLTPEILKACGFKYQDRDTNRKEPTRFYISPWFGNHRQYWLDMNFPIFEGGGFFWWLNWDIGGGKNYIHLPEGAKVIYLHQLQNLWHSLTAGTELTINLEKVKA